MRLVATLILFVAGTAITAPALAADSPQESAIKARQGMMHLRAFNLGPLISMLKGDIPYDAEQASTLANNLEALLAVDMRAAWMEGTSNKDYPDATGALPGIWSQTSDFIEHHDKLVETTTQLAQVAGNGMDAMAPAAKNVAQSCKGCHDNFKED